MSGKLTPQEVSHLAECEFHEKFAFLFDPYDYKICWGGRNGLKSWSIARTLLAIGAKRTIRILCGREIQKTLKDSVHQLLTDQAQSLGLGKFYGIFDNEIRGRNGTLFLFAGFSNMTVESVKSFEGVDILWIEEARNISKRSYEIIIPTIRKTDSEVWISFNPELDTDETYVRFILSPPPKSMSVFTTFADNPWRSEKSENDRLHCQHTDPDAYDNIWLGKPRTAVAGAIYAKEIHQAMLDKRICRVPYDPRLKVHTVWDLGKRDYTAIGLFQKGFSEFRMINYIHDHQQYLPFYAAKLNAMNMNWGWDWLPHDGFISDIKSPSAYQILKDHGRRVKPKIDTTLPVPNVEIETGIKAVRLIFPRLVIDSETCAGFIEAAKRYRRTINTQTQQPGAPLHDQFSDPMDMLRYFALVADKLTNDEELNRRPRVQPVRSYDRGAGAL